MQQRTSCTPESHKKKQSRAVVKLRVGFKTLFYYGSYNKPGATISIDAFTAIHKNLEFPSWGSNTGPFNHYINFQKVGVRIPKLMKTRLKMNFSADRKFQMAKMI